MFSFFTKPKILVDLNEELFDCPLKIEGSIPKWLSGTYVRNGPININIESQKNRHWFDGLSMLHAFAFRDNAVFYTNKFLRTNAYKKVFKQASLNYDGFSNISPQPWYKKLLKHLNFQSQSVLSNANLNVACLDHQCIALSEIPLPVRFDLNALETIGVFNFNDQLPQDDYWESSHPHYDENLKEYINYLIEYGQPNHYLIYRIEEGTSERKLIARIPVQDPSYMHSFAVTENYIILTEFPLIAKGPRIADLSFIDWYKWEPQRGTYFLVIDRKNGQLISRLQTVPFFAFHHVNAYEKDGNIYLDIVCYDDASIISKLKDHCRATAELENRSPSRLVRFTLSLSSNEVTTNILFKKFNEFPKINERFDGKPYQYVYLSDGRDAMLINEIRPLYKLNVQTKEFKSWSEEGCYPGEPFFVSLSDSHFEDDGIILSIVLNAEKYHSFLLILDAKNFNEIGRAIVPHVIPAGLHGKFFKKREAL